MIGRLVRSVDFERALGRPAPVQSAHFAIHHLAEGLAPFHRPRESKLSTGLDPAQAPSVDDPLPKKPALSGAKPATSVKWLGTVVPKRHARHAATRNLVKRQIRAAVGSQGELLTAGIWVVRLRAPFDRVQFPSAASDALKRAARSELEVVLASAVERAGKGVFCVGR